MLCVLVQVVVGDPDVDGFRLKVVDTCGLEDPEAGDTVNYMVSVQWWCLCSAAAGDPAEAARLRSAHMSERACACGQRGAHVLQV